MTTEVVTKVVLVCEPTSRDDRRSYRVFRAKTNSAVDLRTNRPHVLCCSCLEKLVNAQLLKYTTNLIYTHQSAFLPRHSTVTQRAFLINKWQLALDKGLCLESAFLDLSKAYDRVSIAGLMFKPSKCGVSSHALRWFDSFLLNRTQCVRLNGICSSWRCLKSGISAGNSARS